MTSQQYRISPRAPGISYNEGTYFVTVCTANKVHYFGKISDCQMHLSEIGRILKTELENPQLHHEHIIIPQFVVMPNHFHAIIIVRTPNCISNIPESKGERYLPGYAHAARRVPTSRRTTPLLSTYMGALKSAITRKARIINPEFGWQNRYHDRLIRDTYECNKISEYIRDNVIKWDLDRYF